MVEREPDGSLRSGRPVLTPTWATWRQAAAVVRYRPHLRRTVGVALIVGTILFLINQVDVVARGHATEGTWLKIALTYTVPFCVSNYGILVATKRGSEGQ